MGKIRLEAFSDAVLAIVITIMVLEMKIPHEPSVSALVPLVPVFLSYVLSFVYLGIYWNNHHHMPQGEDSVLRRAVGSDWKGKLSPLLYVAAIALTFVTSWVAQIIYVAVAVLWLVPDRRIERTLTHDA